MNDYERFMDEALVVVHNLQSLNSVDSDMESDCLDALIALESAINKAEDRA